MFLSLDTMLSTRVQNRKSEVTRQRPSKKQIFKLFFVLKLIKPQGFQLFRFILLY